MLWTHTRDIILKVERGIVCYQIPICLEGPQGLRQLNLRLNQDLLWSANLPKILELNLNKVFEESIATKPPPYTV